ncbi:GMC oxidoreductase [Rhodotorula toruloides]|uniref:GMC oxidoreductase n=1 Tax=Rhodotorula toruloides TaxID=5286 RepID=A0A511KLL8_RHOTO|nr:GMC oxidoreductase [Rhodotorula toruloides]
MSWRRFLELIILRSGPAGPADPPSPAADAPSYLASLGNYISPFLRRRTSSSSYMPSPPPAADQPALGPLTASTSANAAASTSGAGPSTSTALNGAPAPARGAPTLRAIGTPASDHDVIDLTTSSPPARHRHLVPAVRASGLAFPGAPVPSNAGASTSTAAGPSNGPRPLRRARRPVVYVSDDDDTDDVDYRPRSQLPRTAADTDDDSEIEIVSERAAEPVLHRIHSPPPYIVPPNATATTSVAGRGRGAQLRRSTRVAQTGNHVDEDDADASAARRLAAEYAAEGGVPGDYLAAQARAMDQARAGPPAGLAGRGFGGIFSPGLGGGGGAGNDPFGGILDRQRLIALLGGGLGGFWGGGQFGGFGVNGLYGPPAAQINGGWGGAAKVRAASKKYGVRMSHPRPVEKGFSRDIIEPRDPDTVEPPAKRVKGKGKAKAPLEEMQPVCASCLDPLLLGGEGDKKVFALSCGHVVCAKCLGEAKARCQEIREREKGAWVMDVDESDGGGGKGKGKARDPLLLSDDDDDLYGDGETDFCLSDHVPPTRSSKSSSKRSSKKDKGNGKATASSTSSKLKGKGKSRADGTGIEELWTTCPVSTCDGAETDLLATEGWSRPYELFA